MKKILLTTLFILTMISLTATQYIVVGEVFTRSG